MREVLVLHVILPYKGADFVSMSRCMQICFCKPLAVCCSYAAAAVLQRAKSDAEVIIKSKDLSDEAQEAFKTASAVLEARWGLILMETDKSDAPEEAIDSSSKVQTHHRRYG
jgi:hypothetical protein